MDAGADRTTVASASPLLIGTVNFASVPPGTVSLAWRKVDGPGDVQFTVTNAAVTGVDIDMPGLHTLALTASFDGLVVEDAMALSVYDVYTAWTGRVFAVGHPSRSENENPDGDALLNIEEFFFGTDPNIAEAASPITWAFVDGHLEMYYPRASFGDPNLMLQAAVSDDSSAWDDSVLEVEQSMLLDNGQFQQWKVRDLTPSNLSFRRYLRLLLSGP